MRIKVTVFYFIIAVFFSSFAAQAQAADPSSCEDQLTEKWIGMMDDVKRMETYFMERKWNYLKYWETVYNPLWQAQIRKDDQLSEKRRAEGEVLYARYSRLAEDYLSDAELADEKLTERISSLYEAVKAIPSCCSGHDFRQCMAPRSQDIFERTENFDKILQLRKTVETEFSARVRASVLERPSDHDEFSSRYLEYIERFEGSETVKILRLLRELRDSLEAVWPGQKCCALCVPVSTDTSQDPVLTRLKPNDQGQTGVDGRVVNNASVIKAFEEFEEIKKKKSGKASN